ncbi:hypothetical protein COU60_02700 [Candidatus Pacearchaeota archaeon CG10_big_fil_rev_8_21_14_0_10_34_76]|nr:MAG: hypothetical protein COU60_02700 [Candidatus Pacearchaeota archaeon CG10_big_fil_rev_8_21_14_0_10_34_76]
MKIKVILIAIIIMILGLALGYLMIADESPSNPEDFGGEGDENSIISGNIIKDSENDLGSMADSGGSSDGGSGGNGGGSSGGGGGGNSGSDSGSSENCRESQISYSIQNFTYISECNDEQNGVCVDKNIYCDLDAYNLDSEVDGYFGIGMHVVEEGYQIVDSLSYDFQEIMITNENKKKFQFVFNFQSSGEEGNANKILTCVYTTEKVPKKEICE